ncbi:hypothetical protein ACFXAZ_38430 [Streptomyces sp. NPDC059477]|uniref:hypothetical protein n=1 Tax=Streptomyces sp. NPDC059477 TaxID=3346847 RepID=UPI00369DA5DF
MDPTRIAPGLTLTEAQYAVAAEAIATHLPDLAPLTWNRFTAASGWWLVPERDGDLAKAELVLQEDHLERTVKINLWFLPDLRDAAPRPHSHPWDFTARILTGGYTETRYEARTDRIDTAEVQHLAGGANPIDRATYHEVTGLHAAPGDTMTLMVCGPGERGTWGYLDPDTGTHSRPEADPTFPERLRRLNPHRH